MVSVHGRCDDGYDTRRYELHMRYTPGHLHSWRTSYRFRPASAGSWRFQRPQLRVDQCELSETEIIHRHESTDTRNPSNEGNRWISHPHPNTGSFVQRCRIMQPFNVQISSCNAALQSQGSAHFRPDIGQRVLNERTVHSWNDQRVEHC